MEEYARIAIEEIERQWNNGINPAIYNGCEWWKLINVNMDEYNDDDGSLIVVLILIIVLISIGIFYF